MTAPVSGAEAVIDLDAYRHNLDAVGACAPAAQVMAVVKADGYGHGMIAMARAARDAGADWLGVATPREAMALRAHGVSGPLLCWLATADTAWAEVIEAGIEVTASSRRQLSDIAECGATSRPRVQLKVDTGLTRNGAYGHQWQELIEAAAAAQSAGRIDVTGVWTHLACADEPGSPVTAHQESAFGVAVDQMRAAGLEPGVQHMANSAATLTRPSTHLDMVRVGIAAYGITPDRRLDHDVRLRPVMTLRAPLAHVKRVAAGEGVSYGHTWHTDRPTTLGLVPIGYAEGIHRAASNHIGLGFNGERVRQVGTICMDQFVVDLGDNPARPGDWIHLFGDGTHGEDDANAWAASAGTIGYEVVTRLGGRVERIYREGR